MDELGDFAQVVPLERLEVEIRGEAPCPFVVDHHADFVRDFQCKGQIGIWEVRVIIIAQIAVIQQDSENIPLFLCFVQAVAAELGTDILAEQVDFFAVQKEFSVPGGEFPVAEPDRIAGEAPFGVLHLTDQKVQIGIRRRPPDRIGERKFDRAGVDARLQRDGMPPCSGEFAGILPDCGRSGKVQCGFHGFSGVVEDLVIDLDGTFRQPWRNEQSGDSDFRFQRQRDVLPDAALDILYRPLGPVGVVNLFRIRGVPLIGEHPDCERIASGRAASVTSSSNAVKSPR